jgi:F-type H+-transporting ATPase subunit delta
MSWTGRTGIDKPVSEQPKPNEQEIAVARIYARSAFALAEEQDATESLLNELEELVKQFDREPALERFLSSPLVESGERQQMLDRLFAGRMSEIFLDTLQVMNRKRRSGLVRALAEAYRQEFEERTGKVTVSVRTAVALTEGLRQQLLAATSRFTGREASLTETVDEALIGGMILLVGDRKIDSSVARELLNLEAQLLDRASQESQKEKNYLMESAGQ